MSFNDLLADLDASVFAHLADDTAAIWGRDSGPLPVAVMLEAGERTTVIGGMPQTTSGEVARLSVAQVRVLTEGAPAPRQPIAGETLTINDVVFVIHGEPWLDEEMEGRDWLCPVSR